MGVLGLPDDDDDSNISEGCQGSRTKGTDFCIVALASGQAHEVSRPMKNLDVRLILILILMQQCALLRYPKLTTMSLSQRNP